MILGELLDASRAQSVHPTVSYVANGSQAVFVVKEQRCYRRPHSFQIRLSLAGFEHFAIRLLCGNLEPAPPHGAPSGWISDRGGAGSRLPHNRRIAKCSKPASESRI